MTRVAELERENWALRQALDSLDQQAQQLNVVSDFLGSIFEDMIQACAGEPELQAKMRRVVDRTDVAWGIALRRLTYPAAAPAH